MNLKGRWITNSFQAPHGFRETSIPESNVTSNTDRKQKKNNLGFWTPWLKAQLLQTTISVNFQFTIQIL